MRPNRRGTMCVDDFLGSNPDEDRRRLAAYINLPFWRRLILKDSVDYRHFHLIHRNGKGMNIVAKNMREI